MFGSSAKPSVIANFDTDLSNGLALYAVLVDHWPALLAKGFKLNKAPTTPMHLSENARFVCNMVHHLQLAMDIKVRCPDLKHCYACSLRWLLNTASTCQMMHIDCQWSRFVGHLHAPPAACTGCTIVGNTCILEDLSQPEIAH